MKIIYENFEELADEMIKKDSILYQLNFPKDKDFESWKIGIKNFAEWLDWLGIKIEVENSKEDFYWFKNSNYKWQNKYESIN